FHFCPQDAASGGFDLGRCPVLDQPDNRRQDRASNTAADELPDERADIQSARGLGKYGKEGGQNLPANTATDRAGDCVSGCSKTAIFRSPAGDIAADCTRNKLNDEINQHARHVDLLMLPRLKFTS